MFGSTVRKFLMYDLVIFNFSLRCLSHKQSYFSKNTNTCTSKVQSFFRLEFRPICTALLFPTALGYPKKYSERELKERLSSKQYEVTQKSGTERAFTGEYWDNHRKGIYKCVVCKEDLFTSDTKFESGSGWPSFYDVISKGKVTIIRDSSYGMVRTEVVCASCGSHLGHVFEDGPKPTGQRYCMNSASLEFINKE